MNEIPSERKPISTFSHQDAKVGSRVCVLVSLIIVVYLITLILGFVSLESPDEPIANPYFTMLELLILLLSPLMVVALVFIHQSTPASFKTYSLTAVIFISVMACITCCLHFAILTLSRQEVFHEAEWSELVFSFTWPSLAYALDILAWDFFFALAMVSLSFTVRENELERTLRILLLSSAVLSFAGLLGIPLENMNIRNIGILGYTLFAILIFYLYGTVLKRRATN